MSKKNCSLSNIYCDKISECMNHEHKLTNHQHKLTNFQHKFPLVDVEDSMNCKHARTVDSLKMCRMHELPTPMCESPILMCKLPILMCKLPILMYKSPIL